MESRRNRIEQRGERLKKIRSIFKKKKKQPLVVINLIKTSVIVPRQLRLQLNFSLQPGPGCFMQLLRLVKLVTAAGPL